MVKVLLPLWTECYGSPENKAINFFLGESINSSRSGDIDDVNCAVKVKQREIELAGILR